MYLHENIHIFIKIMGVEKKITRYILYNNRLSLNVWYKNILISGRILRILRGRVGLIVILTGSQSVL